MRLSLGEVESIRAKAYSLALEAALAEEFEIDGLTFEIRKENAIAELVSDVVSEKIKAEMLKLF